MTSLLQHIDAVDLIKFSICISTQTSKKNELIQRYTQVYDWMPYVSSTEEEKNVKERRMKTKGLIKETK